MKQKKGIKIFCSQLLLAKLLYLTKSSLTVLDHQMWVLSFQLSDAYIYLVAQYWFRYPDIKVHGANMGPTWVLSAPDGPHVGLMNLAIRVINHHLTDVKQLIDPRKGSFCIRCFREDPIRICLAFHFIWSDKFRFLRCVMLPCMCGS